MRLIKVCAGFCAVFCNLLVSGCSPSSDTIESTPRQTSIATTQQAVGSMPVRTVNAGTNTSQGWFLGENFVSVSGGAAGSTTQPIETKLYYSAPTAVYQTWRQTGAGSDPTSFTYTIPDLTANTRYVVRLHFAEPTFTSAGSRVFDVSINDEPVLTNYDIFADATKVGSSGTRSAVIKAFNKLSINSQMAVTFTRVTGEALVNGIEVLPGPAYSVNAGGAGVGPFAGDGFFDAGGPIPSIPPSTVIDTTLIQSPPPQDVLKTQHTHNGNFTYTFENLKPAQVYHVRLYFAELDPTKFSIGARKFNVRLNGKIALLNFDAFAAGGKPNWASERTVEAAADALGQIAIQFEQVTGDPIVNGIEIAPQASFQFNVGGLPAPAVDQEDVAFDGELPGYLSENGTSAQVFTASAINLPQSWPTPNAVYHFARRAQKGDAGIFNPHTFTYTFPGLMPGKLYKIRLHFAEIDSWVPEACVGHRKFSIYMNNAIVAKQFDICKEAGGSKFKGVVKDFWFTADGSGRLAIKFVNTLPLTNGPGGVPVENGAMVNGIEVFREPPQVANITNNNPYHVTEIGVVGRPAGVRARDGGASAPIGNNGKSLYVFGDTLLNHASGPNSDPEDATWWTNTAGFAELRAPWLMTEAVFQSGGPETAVPTGQLFPLTQAQYNYNRDHSNGWPCLTANCIKDTVYYAIWPHRAIREPNGDVLVFGAGHFYNPHGYAPDPTAGGDFGTVVVRQPQTATTPTNPTVGSQAVLFSNKERGFLATSVGNDNFIYTYSTNTQFGPLNKPVISGSTVTQIETVGRIDRALLKDELIELYDGVNRQIVKVTESVPADAQIVPVKRLNTETAGFVPNANYAGYPQDGTGLGRLGIDVPNGATRTSITLKGPLVASVPANARLRLTSGSAVQDLRVSTAAAPGATSISVLSFTATATFPSSGDNLTVVSFLPLATVSAVQTTSQSVKLTLSSPLPVQVKTGNRVEIFGTAGRQVAIVSQDASPDATLITLQKFTIVGSLVGANVNFINTLIRPLLAPIGKFLSNTSGNNIQSITLANPPAVPLSPAFVDPALTIPYKLQFWTHTSQGVQKVHVVTLTHYEDQTDGVIRVQGFSPGVTIPANTVVYQSVDFPSPVLGVPYTRAFWNVLYCARAPYSQDLATGYYNRANWRYWNQALNGFRGGWDASMVNGTPVLTAGGTTPTNYDGAPTYTDAPLANWNPYLGRYVTVRATVSDLTTALYLSTAHNPGGPWAKDILLTMGNTSTIGLYAINHHPEMDLNGGQTIFASYTHGEDGGSVRMLEIHLPPANEIPAPPPPLP